MKEIRRGHRRATILTLAFVTVVVLGTVMAPGAEAGYRARVLRMVNNARDNRDLHLVKIDRSLSRKAMRHTRKMIANGAIYDPRNLVRLLRGEPWTTVGASNAGCAGTLRGLHKALMRSSEHRANILNRDVRRIGIGVIKVNARNACGRHWFWETQLFYG
jgi:uncharacterized protein YkwD